MKKIVSYTWIIVLLLMAVHGTSLIQKEWTIKSIHGDGETVEVKIEELNCPDQIMSFRFKDNLFKKKIDARTCVIYNEGQIIKLRHNEHYPDKFLFVNERNPNQFILGGLEIIIGLLGLLANWPFFKSKSAIPISTR